ncbi:hypothetical protein BGX21_009722 [Mortierella sp. AD011]|nr:hypothetical protein BGX20_006858 [Mortierella sp. AD010]KAF9395960.1 hypothetical protein BGX21_009722 [Mortierella sp. AD011]
MDSAYSETLIASEAADASAVVASTSTSTSIPSLSIQNTPILTSNNVDDTANNSGNSGMDFFFAQVPTDSDWLRGATELDIRLSPVLQDRIAQSCLIKMQQASSGRESLQRLAQLSRFWRRLQTEMLSMPMFTAPQVPAPLDQWFAEFAASSPEASSSLMQGLSTDFNWNLDLLVSSSPPSSNGLMGYELGSLWNIMDSQDFASTVGNNNYSLPLPTPSSTILPSSEPIDQGLAEVVAATVAVDGASSSSAMLQDSRMNNIQAGPVVTSIPETLPASSNTTAWSNDGPTDYRVETNISIDDSQDLPKDDYINSEVTSMDVDLPMQDMTLTSPPPSMPSKTRKKPASNQRRATIPRKAKRTVRRQPRKLSKESLSFKARLASEIEETESDEDVLEHADRNKRRRGSKDSSSSSDSGPESAPGSPQTPPSTYDGLNATVAASEQSPSRNSDVSEPLFAVAFQETILSSDKTSHLSAAVAVEDLVNLKRLEEEESHSSFQRRPSTRAFGQS